MTYDELLKRINESYQNMSPQVQLAARYVIDNAEDVALVSMRQLAKEANVHPTTMVRLGQFWGLKASTTCAIFFNIACACPRKIMSDVHEVYNVKPVMPLN
ncbi:MurR/RpiR family transcriptional regulator [Terasakiella sp.]|uniref:MurR/RpiR family transcriptional regulator n=1 Tax=Terasakiella sp. TaxID=2034861 RepID=UPI003AFF8196